MSEKLIKIGHFKAAHGIRGHIKVECYTDSHEDMINLCPVLTQDMTPYHLKKISLWKHGIIAAVDGILSRTQAEILCGQDIYTSYGCLPQLQERELYHVDLIGIHAQIRQRAMTAEIIAFHNFGSCDIMEVQPSWASKTVMVPFEKSIVTEIDINNKVVVIDPVPGLFDTPEQ